jgi:hypothetical protein
MIRPFDHSRVVDHDQRHLWTSDQQKSIIRQGWHRELLHQGHRFYSCGHRIDWLHLEMVRAIPHHRILDPFERIIEHDEPPITHPRNGDNYGTCPDAPEVVKWARLHPLKARIPLTYARSKYAASRLRFFRRMHRWMHHTDRVFTALILAKHECTLQDLDKTKATFELMNRRPPTTRISVWVSLHCAHDHN